jgi:hypothetical protein
MRCNIDTKTFAEMVKTINRYMGNVTLPVDLFVNYADNDGPETGEGVLTIIVSTEKYIRRAIPVSNVVPGQLSLSFMTLVKIAKAKQKMITFELIREGVLRVVTNYSMDLYCEEYKGYPEKFDRSSGSLIVLSPEGVDTMKSILGIVSYDNILIDKKIERKNTFPFVIDSCPTTDRYCSSCLSKTRNVCAGNADNNPCDNWSGDGGTHFMFADSAHSVFYIHPKPLSDIKFSLYLYYSDISSLFSNINSDNISMYVTETCVVFENYWVTASMPLLNYEIVRNVFNVVQRLDGFGEGESFVGYGNDHHLNPKEVIDVFNGMDIITEDANDMLELPFNPNSMEVRLHSGKGKLSCNVVTEGESSFVISVSLKDFIDIVKSYKTCSKILFQTTTGPVKMGKMYCFKITGYHGDITIISTCRCYESVMVNKVVSKDFVGNMIPPDGLTPGLVSQ